MLASSSNAKKTRGRPFQPGNKIGRGRPQGSCNKATLAAQALLDGEADGLTRKAIEWAKDGDKIALKLCLERIIPPKRDRPVRFTFTPPANAEQIPAAIGRVIKAASTGRLTPGEGQAVVTLLDCQRKAFETAQLAAVVEELQNQVEELTSLVETERSEREGH